MPPVIDIEEYADHHTHFYENEIPAFLRILLAQHKWSSYLDLGCGDGSLLYAINRQGTLKNTQVYAVDLSKSRIESVKKINSNFICYVADACNAKDIPDKSIDLLVSTQVIEHVPNDEDMIKEINRLLSVGGTVYLSTVFKKWYGWYFYRCNGKWRLDPTHLREYTADSQLLPLFEKHGFKLVKMDKILLKFPIADLFLRILGVKDHVFNNAIINSLRKIKIPILGYYDWEMVFERV
jgi:2-polyprenyl-3-methyl-5-hydroxy-6-metoxy-1,4-benzoquinol methylase